MGKVDALLQYIEGRRFSRPYNAVLANDLDRLAHALKSGIDLTLVERYWILNLLDQKGSLIPALTQELRNKLLPVNPFSGTIDFESETDRHSLTLRTASENFSFFLEQLTSDQLLIKSANGRIIPRLARYCVPKNNFRTWVIELQGARWSSGEKIDTADVSTTLAESANRLNIASIQTSRNTVEVMLNQNNAGFDAQAGRIRLKARGKTSGCYEVVDCDNTGYYFRPNSFANVRTIQEIRLDSISRTPDLQTLSVPTSERFPQSPFRNQSLYYTLFLNPQLLSTGERYKLVSQLDYEAIHNCLNGESYAPLKKSPVYFDLRFAYLGRVFGEKKLAGLIAHNLSATVKQIETPYTKGIHALCWVINLGTSYTLLRYFFGTGILGYHSKKIARWLTELDNTYPAYLRAELAEVILKEAQNDLVCVILAPASEFVKSPYQIRWLQHHSGIASLLQDMQNLSINYHAETNS